MGKGLKHRKKKRKKSKKSLAAKWDSYVLYQLSVQDPVSPTVELMREEFLRRRGRQAELLREDFCGTALLSCEWIRDRPHHRAIGLDLDPEPLDWSREHFLPQLGDDAGRVELRQQDVRDGIPERADIACAYNFSYMFLDTREALRDYFANIRAGLADDGMFFVDLFGGSEAMGTLEESTEVDMDAEDADSPLLGHLLEDRRAEFEYCWEQYSFNPIDHRMRCRISFDFPDGSRQKHRFTYDWRLWTIPEVRELMREAGFEHTAVYGETYDADGDFDGYAPMDVIDDDPCWIVFICAW